MRHFSKYLLAASIATIATAALAAVTFDPDTGTGFVGKGDVQLVFGWNNAQLQANATNVAFKYDATESAFVTIQFSTGNPDKPQTIKTHEVTQTKSASVLSSLNGSPRQEKGQTQFTGFNLLGFLGSPVVTGDAIPNVGDSCPNGDLGDCVVIAVTPGPSSGGLYACWPGLGGTCYLIQ